MAQRQHELTMSQPRGDGLQGLKFYLMLRQTPWDSNIS